MLRFTMVLLKIVSNQIWIRYQCVYIFKTDNFQLWFLFKTDFRISTARKLLLELTIFKSIEKRQYLPHYWSDKGFRCTFVNRPLHWTFTYNYAYCSIMMDDILTLFNNCLMKYWSKKLQGEEKINLINWVNGLCPNLVWNSVLFKIMQFLSKSKSKIAYM